MTQFTHLDAEAASHLVEAAIAEHDAALEKKRPFMLLRPRIFPDGDKWCVLYGDNIQEGICGFGDTPQKASIDFDIQWLNGLAWRKR